METLQELENIYLEKHELEAKLEELKAKEQDLRAIILKSMQEEGIERQRTERIMVYTTTTKDLEITDEIEVRAYLQNRGLLEECISLNKAKVKSIAKKTGDMPGVTPTERTSITVREIQEEVVPVTDTESSQDFRSRVRGEL